jgi:hypothetical protein
LAAPPLAAEVLLKEVVPMSNGDLRSGGPAPLRPVPGYGALAGPAPEAVSSLRTLYMWFAILTGVGIIPCLNCLTFIPQIVIGCILLYKLWTVIQDGYARTTPGVAVGFCFIPIFNFYWIFVAYHGLGQDLNRYLRDAGIRAQPVGALPLFYCIIVVASIPVGIVTFILNMALPFLGTLLVQLPWSIVVAVVAILMMKQLTDVAAAILQHKLDAQFIAPVPPPLENVPPAAGQV